MFRVVLPLLLIVPSAAAAQTVSGTAEVVDGDTLRIGEQRVRLFGVDAPEANQTCERNNERWACGNAATEQLRSIAEGQTVTCQQRDIDPYDRVVAVCHAGGYELGQTMVRYGWATAYRRYSEDYVADELRAKAERLGLWRSTFERPDQYRMAQRAASEPKTSATNASSARRQPTSSHDGSCTIKGNHSRRGEWIYHLPGMPYYEATWPEAMFCTEAAAQAAGYRRAKVR